MQPDKAEPNPLPEETFPQDICLPFLKNLTLEDRKNSL